MQKWLWPVLILIFIFTITFVIASRSRIKKEGNNSQSWYPTTGPASDAAYQEGKNLSNGQCQGMEIRKLGTLPMKYEDFSMIIPYGLVTGDHVTPIDHQYFSPAVFDSPRDAYPVYAMAEAHIVDIQPRVKPGYTEYRFVFSLSCRLFYYYDLVTSLTPNIKKEFDQAKNGPFPRPLNIAVREGELVGRIGGQTLDFAVWDTQSILKGFIDPKDYEEETWKIHTVDPLDYYTPELKKLALSKYIRTVEPLSGKIDYDVDGRLTGNWFREGTEGYRGTKRQTVQNYSQTHLAVVPNHLDPSFYMASFGNFAGEFKQFVIKQARLSPQEVVVNSGLVKYDLVNFSYVQEDGSFWDGKSFAKNIKLILSDQLGGCALYQLLADRRLKVETFTSQTCDRIQGFSSRALIYTR